MYICQPLPSSLINTPKFQRLTCRSPGDACFVKSPSPLPLSLIWKPKQQKGRTLVGRFEFFPINKRQIPKSRLSSTPTLKTQSFSQKGFLSFPFLQRMENVGEGGGVLVEEGEKTAALFSEEELREMSGVKKGSNYIEVTCGCTSHRYGDAIGRLKVFPNGDLLITCECTPGCNEDKMTPAAFEKHSGRETARKWKNNVWVIVNGEKIPLYKTVLLKYYNQALKSANGSQRSHSGRAFHRDEFVRCSKCQKDRRFRLRTGEECRIHHDALADANWQCSDIPFYKVTCDDDEERASRRVYRGCTLSPTCKGCTSCVCFGCETCRFLDCSCQTCMDFTKN